MSSGFGHVLGDPGGATRSGAMASSAIRQAKLRPLILFQSGKMTIANEVVEEAFDIQSAQLLGRDPPTPVRGGKG